MKALIMIIALLFIIISHEFGHMVAALACGIKVNEFSVGWGKVVVQKTWKNIIFSVRALPAGGFCTLDDDAFDNAPHVKKLVILFAGAFINFLTAFIFFVMVTGDVAGSFVLIGKTFVSIVTVINMLFTGGLNSSDLTGVGGFATGVGSMITGVKSALLLIGLLASIIGAFNLLPIPGLDGGRIVGTLFEMITHRKIPDNVHRAVNIFVYVFMIFSIFMAIYFDARDLIMLGL